MATPDDLEEFRACQMSYLGRASRWNDLSRGAAHWIQGADEAAESIGLKPLMSGARTEDEGLFDDPPTDGGQAPTRAMTSFCTGEMTSAAATRVRQRQAPRTPLATRQIQGSAEMVLRCSRVRFIRQQWGFAFDPQCFGDPAESVAPLGAPQRLVRCSKAVIKATGGR
jgi:hypothetical protein